MNIKKRDNFILWYPLLCTTIFAFKCLGFVFCTNVYDFKLDIYCIWWTCNYQQICFSFATGVLPGFWEVTPVSTLNTGGTACVCMADHKWWEKGLEKWICYFLFAFKILSKFL